MRRSSRPTSRKCWWEISCRRCSRKRPRLNTSMPKMIKVSALFVLAAIIAPLRLWLQRGRTWHLHCNDRERKNEPKFSDAFFRCDSLFFYSHPVIKKSCMKIKIHESLFNNIIEFNSRFNQYGLFEKIAIYLYFSSIHIIHNKNTYTY